VCSPLMFVFPQKIQITPKNNKAKERERERSQPIKVTKMTDFNGILFIRFILLSFFESQNTHKTRNEKKIET